MDFHLGPDPVRVRRMLERPFGSVRWKEDSPDRAASEGLPVAAAAGSSTECLCTIIAWHRGPAMPRKRSEEPQNCGSLSGELPGLLESPAHHCTGAGAQIVALL